MKSRIFIIDDEQDFLDSVKRGLITSGFNNIRVETDPLMAASYVEKGDHPDIAFIDITMPRMNGMELLEKIKIHSPTTECVMVSAVNEARIAVECLKKGAYDYLVKPISRDDLVLTINRALERSRFIDLLTLGKSKKAPKLRDPEAFQSIVTQSAGMMILLREAELHAASDAPVLITGESGTGKELLAMAIHLASPRCKAPFSPVNMAALNSTLFDAEFFGHTRGAFTGAEKNRVGYLEYANKGTLFLDEIGNLPFDLQAKLLRVLQDGEYIKIGTSFTQKADVRFIAATNSDLDKQVSEGNFRNDLYYRMKVAWLDLPPLRERKDDITLLIGKFLEDFVNSSGKCTINEEALSLLTEYDYPGNIRELRSIIQSAVNLAQGGTITPDILPSHLKRHKRDVRPKVLNGSGPFLPLAQVEKDHILNIYHQTGQNKSQTANLLDIGLNTLRRKLASYDIA